MTALWRLVKRSLIIVILIWGTLVVLVRLGSPLLEHVREPLAERFSQLSGQTIKIGKLRADWQGLRPRLHIEQVTVGHAEQPVHLRHITLELALADLFGGSPLNALRVTLTGLELSMLREANGQVHMVGLPAFDLESEAETRSLLALPGRLLLHDTRLHWQDLRVQRARPLYIDDLYLDLQRDGERLSVRARLDSDLGQARLAADIVGSLQQTDWSGSTYLQVNDLQLAQLISAYLPTHYRMHGGRVDMQIWQQWSDATPIDSRGQLNLRDVRLANDNEDPHQVVFEQVAGDFQFDRIDGSQWQLQVDDISVSGQGHSPWPKGRIAMRRNFVEGQSQVAVAVDHLIIDDLVDLLLIRAPTAEAGEALRHLLPRGQVNDLRLRLPLPQKDHWVASADFEGIAFNAWKKIPGVSNLSGRINADPQHASLELYSREVPVDYPSMFRYPLHAKRLLGKLHFRRLEDGWELLSNALQLDTPDVHSMSRFSLRHRTSQPAHLELISELRNGNVAATPKYLPTAIMSEKLVSWLDGALSRGHLEKATALLSGPLDTFPYHKQRNGTFEVEALIHDTPLHYREGWPALQDVSALLAFHEYSMDIELLEGRVYNSPIQHLHARIANLWPTSPLHITGRIAGPVEDQLKVLREGALRKDFGHIAEALSVVGNAELDLDFEVPLSQVGKYRLDGALLFKNATMSLPEWELHVKNINGELAINLDSLHAKSIRGETLGAPMSVSVVPREDSGTRVSTRVRLDKSAIARKIPQLPLQLADGSSDFNIDIDIPGVSAKAGTPTWLTVSSDLQGMRLELPVPLGKTADQRRDLQVSVPISEETQHPISISYDGKLSAIIAADGQTADIRYQRGAAQKPEKPGYRLRIKVPEIDLSVWQALAGKLGDAEGPVPDWHADIETERLQLEGLALEQASLNVMSVNKTISGGITSNQLNGSFHYPSSKGQPFEVRLQKAHLDYETGSETQDSRQAPKPATKPDPRLLPPIQATCEDLRINRARLGKARLQTRPVTSGMRIEKFSFEGPDGEFAASGHWGWRDGVQHTDLAGSLESPDLGVLLHRLGHARHMRDARAKTKFDLNWPGHPGQIHMATLAGSLDAKISEGRLAEVDPGITRVLGLLNVDALTRRLKLDFGDLVKKGYSFDKISGSFRFDKGNAFTNDLVVDGPASDIEIGGRIGLLDHELEQLVSVTPKLDATLPIISTIAGGPVAGIATLLAQEFMADEVDQLNRFEYAVSGNWDKPKLTPLDSGGGLSRLVNTLKGEKTEARTAEQENLIQREESTKRGPLGRLLDALPGGDKETPAE